ncbi:hypothetical protein SCLCIDRAFT_1221334 [Scleroderma citrinum Foug A]|uniref:Uncharacterized protein n=1 Tax=Scleroderma citrinum Foug A TaxID=1036808 RepID=A0A0C3DGJ3_9AGAM|nr:hypothetical protein SCLCIDRAFT_1221334 [Scleroderma citrinum Foug A]
MFGPPSGIWLVILAFLGSVWAYTIDDSDYSVLKFSENPAGPVWGPFGSDTGEQLSIRLPNGTMMAINSVQCYDGTYTYAACSTSNNCAVQFSFTGSGITIYVLQAGPQGMSASLSIDSGSATTATLAAPPAPQYNIPHVVLFSVQNLVSGTHTAIMTVLDWDGGFSGMMLDYIDVNEAIVAGSSSTTPSSTSTPTPTSSQTLTSASSPSQGSTSHSTQSSLSASSPSIASSFINQTSLSGVPTATSSTASGGGNDSSSQLHSSSKKNNVAAIAGGATAGAVGLLALCGLALFCFRRRRSRATGGNITPLLNERPASRFLDGAIADPFARDPTLTNDLSFSTSDVARLSLRDVEATTPSGGGPSSGRSPLSVQDSAGQSGAVVVNATSRNNVDSEQTPMRTLPAIPVSSTTPTAWPNEKASSSRDAGQESAAVPLAQSGDQPVLTDEQADFVTSLYQNNVPVAVVARVLERMLANPNPQGAASAVGAYDPELRPYMGNAQPVPPASYARRMSWFDGGASQYGDGETTIGTAPPSYDYARGQ